MDPIQLLVDTLTQYGLVGAIAAAVILIGVFFAKKAGLVATPNQARIANIVLSAVLYGLSDTPQSEGAIMAVLSSVLAGLAYEGLKYISKEQIKL
jgi:hypothetical protein